MTEINVLAILRLRLFHFATKRGVFARNSFFALKCSAYASVRCFDIFSAWAYVGSMEFAKLRRMRACGQFGGQNVFEDKGKNHTLNENYDTVIDNCGMKLVISYTMDTMLWKL